MGLRGPAKKPADLQERKGNPSKRRLEAVEENATTGGADLFAIEKPDWLVEEASDHWDVLIPKLVQANMINALDVDLLGKYCQCTGMAIAAERVILRQGPTIKNSNRTVSMRPEVKIAETMWKSAAKLADVIGLTPKSRKAMGIALRKPREVDASEARKSRIRGK